MVEPEYIQDDGPDVVVDERGHLTFFWDTNSPEWKEIKRQRRERNKKIGIAAGIGAAIAGLFAWGQHKKNKKKRKREEEALLSGLGQSRRPDEEIVMIDENTGQLININKYKRPTPTYLSNDEKTGLYVLGGIGLLALTIIILKK